MVTLDRHTIKMTNLHNSWVIMIDCVKRFLKVATALTLPISILQASNKAVTVEWSTWNPDWRLDKILRSDKLA